MTWTRTPRPDLSVRRHRKALPARPGAYYELLSVGRSIGYWRPGGRPDLWVARYRTKTGGYRERQIGRADTRMRADGDRVLSYEQAVEAARAWFGSKAVRNLALPTKPLGPVTTLAYRSPGEREPGAPYTVGDALAEWFA